MELDEEELPDDVVSRLVGDAGFEMTSFLSSRETTWLKAASSEATRIVVRNVPGSHHVSFETMSTDDPVLSRSTAVEIP